MWIRAACGSNPELGIWQDQRQRDDALNGLKNGRYKVRDAKDFELRSPTG